MDSIPADFQWLGGAAFAIATAVLAAWSKVFGKNEGPTGAEAQESLSPASSPIWGR
ncbi:hypothetical protein [Devosia sp. SD17-2]|uniref:hypothetical protein n=1 Tax=Devosia sp. SD17-2 TaxID=2976459 RepID=UPI0023D81E7D|nr:hypothetical protein [Devosia sp. SD17-2]WEJ35027.1 hypothetical protein NYQ88_09590 [Devosia sp. SD17-2]